MLPQRLVRTRERSALVAPPFFSAVGLMVPSHRRNEFFGETQRFLLADTRDLRRTDAEAQRHGKHKSLMRDGAYVLFLASAKIVVSPRLLREMLHIVAPRIEAYLQQCSRIWRVLTLTESCG